MSEAIIRTEQIADKILVLRRHKILLDRDLAALYEVETRVLNQAVTRNAARFPEDFMFALTRDEIVRESQFVTQREIGFHVRESALRYGTRRR